MIAFWALPLRPGEPVSIMRWPWLSVWVGTGRPVAGVFPLAGVPTRPPWVDVPVLGLTVDPSPVLAAGSGVIPLNGELPSVTEGAATGLGGLSDTGIWGFVALEPESPGGFNGMTSSPFGFPGGISPFWLFLPPLLLLPSLGTSVSGDDLLGSLPPLAGSFFPPLWSPSLEPVGGFCLRLATRR